MIVVATGPKEGLLLLIPTLQSGGALTGAVLHQL